MGFMAISEKLTIAASPAELSVSQKAPSQKRSAHALGLSPTFFVTRILGALFSIWGVVTLVFFMLQATGSPASFLIGGAGTREELDRINALYGFDQPVFEQYLRFLANTLSGNFPDSIRFDTSPLFILGPAIGYTLVLTATAIVLGVCIGLLVGYYAAFGKVEPLKNLVLTLMQILQATPSFVIAIFFVFIFAVGLSWLPTQGAGTPLHLILPTVSLSFVVAPPIARLFRSNLIQLSDADHVAAASLKGISLGRLRIRHIALNALPPVVVLIGLQFGGLLGGAILTETVFGWPGIGTAIINATDAKDFPVIIAGVIFIAIGVIVTTLLADILVRILDPRTGVSK